MCRVARLPDFKPEIDWSEVLRWINFTDSKNENIFFEINKSSNSSFFYKSQP